MCIFLYIYIFIYVSIFIYRYMYIAIPYWLFPIADYLLFMKSYLVELNVPDGHGKLGDVRPAGRAGTFSSTR